MPSIVYGIDHPVMTPFFQRYYGSEYIGAPTAKRTSAYTLAIESMPGQTHNTIPPGAYTYQADVETIHNLVEMEFFELETFTDREDFLRKARTYQLYFNLLRPNSYKEGKTPWQLAKEKAPYLPIKTAMIPPVFIENLMENRLEKNLSGGHDVPSTPSELTHNNKCVRKGFVASEMKSIRNGGGLPSVGWQGWHCGGNADFGDC
jgi:hypothetical protein